jgi:hypothetical protein
VRSSDKSLVADGFAAAAFVIAVVLTGMQAIAFWGWLAKNLAIPLYWGLVLAWIVCVVFLLCRRKHYWILLTAPIVLLPALFYVLIIISCMQGDCL